LLDGLLEEELLKELKELDDEELLEELEELEELDDEELLEEELPLVSPYSFNCSADSK
jgi:hypothetical protein